MSELAGGEARSDSTEAGARFQRLVEIMRTLRSEQGCAWDRQQTLRTLRPFVLQETYELLDALDHGDYESLEQELGDFLFEAVFLAQICAEEGRFTIADSIQAIADKLVRRHPHIFDENGTTSLTPKEVKQQWEEIKSKERTDAGQADNTILSGVPRSMPSLLRAFELSTRAAQVGFDWKTQGDVIDKAEEEIKELREAVAAGGGTSAHSEEEFGDLLFSLVNVARKLGIEPEAALRVANDKFQRRFDHLEGQVIESGRPFRDHSLDELEAYWQNAKATTSTRATKDAK